VIQFIVCPTLAQGLLLMLLLLLQIAEGLFIVPEWSEPIDPAALNIRLTPGVAFGTGQL
jgi:ribosomal protein L11 methylase PrmA